MEHPWSPLPRDLLRMPEIASAMDLVFAAESDEDYDCALYSVVDALRVCQATAAERSPVWRRLIEAGA